jgi:molecular chaperone HtpG
LIDKDTKQESVLSDKEKEEVKSIFEAVVGDKSHTVAVESLSPDDYPVTITFPEFMRRMTDMQKTGGGMPFMGSMPNSQIVSINGNHRIIQNILKESKDDLKKDLAQQAYDLALLSQNMLDGNKLTSFIKRSLDMIAK